MKQGLCLNFSFGCSLFLCYAERSEIGSESCHPQARKSKSLQSKKNTEMEMNHP